MLYSPHKRIVMDKYKFISIIFALFLIAAIAGIFSMRGKLTNVTDDREQKMDSAQQLIDSLQAGRLALKLKSKEDSLTIDSISKARNKIIYLQQMVESEVNILTGDQLYSEFNQFTNNDPKSDSVYLTSKEALRSTIKVFRMLPLCKEENENLRAEIKRREQNSITKDKIISSLETENSALGYQKALLKEENQELKDKNKRLGKTIKILTIGGGAAIILLAIISVS